MVTTLPLTTDADGKATFSVSGLPDQAPGTPGDKYVVDIQDRSGSQRQRTGGKHCHRHFVDG